MNKFVFSLGVLALAGIAQAATVSTYLDTSNTVDAPLNSNPAYQPTSIYNYIGYADSGTRYTVVLIKFDLPTLPDDAVINSATLRVSTLGYGNDNANPINADVHAVLKPFTNALTWDHYDGVNAWSTPGLGAGTDYEATATTSISFAAAGAHDVDITSQYIQWFDGLEANNGLVFRPSNPSSDGYLRLASTEGSSTGLELVIDYTVVPEPASLGLIGLSAVTLLRRRR